MKKINKTCVTSLLMILAVAVFGVSVYPKVIIDNVQQMEKASEIYGSGESKSCSCPEMGEVNLPIPSYLEEYIIRGIAAGPSGSKRPSEFIKSGDCPSGASRETVHCSTGGSVCGRHYSCPCIYPVHCACEQPKHFTDADGNIWIPIWGTWRLRHGAGVSYYDHNGNRISGPAYRHPHYWTKIDCCIVAPLGMEITKPSDCEDFDITKEPAMPKVDCSAKVVGIDPDPTTTTEFDWEATITYTEYGRNDKHSFTSEKVLGGNWTPDFKNVIAGGDIKIRAEATIDEETYTDEVTAHIRGTNPNKEIVKEMLGRIILQVICYKESFPKWHQFNPSPGAPVVNPAGPAFGLMQLMSPRPTSEQIWNWKANIKAGKDLYNGKRKQSKQHVKNERKKYPKAKNLIPGQEKRQVCCMYRKGTPEGEYYYVWGTEENKWIPNPKREVIDDLKTGMNYADDCVKIEEDVDAGNPPDGW